MLLIPSYNNTYCCNNQHAYGVQIQCVFPRQRWINTDNLQVIRLYSSEYIVYPLPSALTIFLWTDTKIDSVSAYTFQYNFPKITFKSPWLKFYMFPNVRHTFIGHRLVYNHNMVYNHLHYGSVSVLILWRQPYFLLFQVPRELLTGWALHSHIWWQINLH